MNTFAEWIQGELKRRKWSQPRLAERVSLSLSSIRGSWSQAAGSLE